MDLADSRRAVSEIVDKDGGRADGAGPSGQPGYARLPPFLNLSVIRVIRVPLIRVIRVP